MDKKLAAPATAARVWQVAVPFTIDGRYLLETSIGTTPLGASYAGRDLHQTHRAVEILLFHPAIFADKRRANANYERLERAVTYVHPHVAPTWATGESGGAVWAVTAPSAGQPLTIWRRDAQIIRRDIYRVLGQILSAMETIHEQGGAHGALSPDTVRVVNGHAWVVNPWWLEGAADVPEGDVPPMRTAWLAPEQLAGDGEEGADTDVYGLGLILGYCIARGLTEPGHSLLVQGFDISPSLDEIYVRATARQRVARYPTVALLREALENALGLEWREAQWHHPVNPADLANVLPDVDLDLIDPVAAEYPDEATVNEWLPPDHDIASTMEDELASAGPGASAPADVRPVPIPTEAGAVGVPAGGGVRAARPTTPIDSLGPKVPAAAGAMPAAEREFELPFDGSREPVTPAYGSSLEALDMGLPAGAPSLPPLPPAVEEGPPPIPTSERPRPVIPTGERARPDVPPPIPTGERVRPDAGTARVPTAERARPVASSESSVAPLPPLPTAPIPGRPGGSDLRAIPEFDSIASEFSLGGDAPLDGREATITEAIAPSLLAHDVFGLADEAPGQVVPPQLVDHSPRALWEEPGQELAEPPAPRSASAGFGPPPTTGPSSLVITVPALYTVDPLGPAAVVKRRGLTGRFVRPLSRMLRRPGLAIAPDSGLLPAHKEGRIGVAPRPARRARTGQRALHIALYALGGAAVVALCFIVFSDPGSDPRGLATTNPVVAGAADVSSDTDAPSDAESGAASLAFLSNDSGSSAATGIVWDHPTGEGQGDVHVAAVDGAASADAGALSLDVSVEVAAEVVADASVDAVGGPETATETVAETVAETALASVADAAPEVTADAGPAVAFAPKDPDKMTCPGGMSKLKKKIKVKLPDGSEAADWEVACIDRYEYPGAGAVPVAGVDVAGARAACQGKGKRLCTHAEWRRACGGTYPYGKEFDPEKCRVMGADGAAVSVGPAGSQSGCRSPSGAMDMVGNVAEWTSDGYINGGSHKNGEDATCNTMSRRAGGAPHIGFRCCADATGGK